MEKDLKLFYLSEAQIQYRTRQEWQRKAQESKPSKTALVIVTGSNPSTQSAFSDSSTSPFVVGVGWFGGDSDGKQHRFFFFFSRTFANICYGKPRGI